MSLDNFPHLALSLRSLVQHGLHQVLHIQSQKWHIESLCSPSTEATHTDDSRFSLIRDIPVKLVINQTRFFYVSAIALQLEKKLETPAIEIAKELLERLSQRSFEPHLTTKTSGLDQVWKCFTIQINGPGLLCFELTDQGIGKWLNLLINLDGKLKNSPQLEGDRLEKIGNHLRNPTVTPHILRNSTNEKFLPRNSTDLLQIQHAHARCCTLLRLGEQNGMILRAAPFSLGSGEPPWLEGNVIRCRQPSEVELIQQLCRGWDHVADRLATTELPIANFTDLSTSADPPSVRISSKPDKTVKLMTEVCQAFFQFYASSSIFGEAAVNTPNLAQARLGLVALTRSLLETLLASLGIEAAIEL